MTQDYKKREEHKRPCEIQEQQRQKERKVTELQRLKEKYE